MATGAGGMAVGVVEFGCVSAGLNGLDRIVKNHHVRILRAEMICPGRYLVVCGGSHAAVEEAVAQLRRDFAATLANERVIGNLSEGIIEAFRPAKGDVCTDAIGVVETGDVVTAVYAADEAVKTAGVAIIGLRMASGIGGKGVAVFAGGIADVSAALERAARLCELQGTLVGRAFITNPDRVVVESIAQRT